jgi:hypothetical protein
MFIPSLCTEQLIPPFVSPGLRKHANKPHSVMRLHGYVSINASPATTPPKHKEPPATATATNKKGPRRGPHVNSLCTPRGSKPLVREHTCPRWDPNRVPALANPPLPRRHRQSGPVRHQYDPIRSTGCAHCAHPFLCLAATIRRRQKPPRYTTPGRRQARQEILVPIWSKVWGPRTPSLPFPSPVASLAVHRVSDGGGHDRIERAQGRSQQQMSLSPFGDIMVDRKGRTP